ncbi:MAG: hypothetical protein ABIG11_07960 [bacterium]
MRISIFFLSLFFSHTVSLTVYAIELSLEDKAGQLIMVSSDARDAEKYRSVLESGAAGGILLQWGSF